MRTALMLVVVAAGCMVPALGQADEADAGACTPVTHDTAIELQAIAEKLMSLAAKPLDDLETLDTRRSAIDTVRSIASKTRCAYGMLTPKERGSAETFVGRAERWADGQSARLAAEEDARQNAIVPLCQATWQLDQAKAEIAREKSNPSGVHDLRVLHSAGAAAQAAQDSIGALKPAYVAHRRHPFNGWRTEGACVAASR